MNRRDATHIRIRHRIMLAQAERRRERRLREAVNDNQPQPKYGMLTLLNGCCLEKMKALPDQSVHMIFADLPYAQSAFNWDKLIPMEPFWAEVGRVLKSSGVVVMTSAGMFTAQLMLSKPDWYRYSMVWVKTKKTGFVHAKYRPMGQHEDVLVFSPGKATACATTKMTYRPQGLTELTGVKVRKGETRSVMGKPVRTYADVDQTHTGYPTTVLQYPSVARGHHPTQKPHDLLAYLIRTYSDPGDTVLDPTMGSGSTGMAAIQEGRSFIGIERDRDFFLGAQGRLEGLRTAA
ncbi:site-specific DNA-methyltransferase [Brevundimonas sp.]|uniref:DNA-methyltransferase n=1 Tax=Brevundimonas sp. TaxID=1871086 RepID=UPI0035B00B10